VILADFQIDVEFEVPRSVRVIVYDSLKGLRIGATRYENHSKTKRRRKHGLFSGTLGICHRFEWLGIVSHEMLHAAVWMRELNGESDELTTANDEPICWVLGELVRQTINTMNERGVYEAVEAISDAT
jgi:hypothetical protein